MPILTHACIMCTLIQINPMSLSFNFTQCYGRFVNTSSAFYQGFKYYWWVLESLVRMSIKYYWWVLESLVRMSIKYYWWVLETLVRMSIKYYCWVVQSFLTMSIKYYWWVVERLVKLGFGLVNVHTIVLFQMCYTQK